MTGVVPSVTGLSKPPAESCRNQMKLTKRAVEEILCIQAICRITFHLHYDHYFYRPHDKKTYLAVGSMKTLLLNISLLNVGDDAYETVLHFQIPKGLYFIRVLELVRTTTKNLSNSNHLIFFFFSQTFFKLCY